jgi:hypothetical protein
MLLVGSCVKPGIQQTLLEQQCLGELACTAQWLQPRSAGTAMPCDTGLH